MFELLDYKALEDTLGIDWWVRIHRSHGNCSNPICRHKEETQANTPMRVHYYKDICMLKVSFSFTVRSCLVDLPPSFSQPCATIPSMQINPLSLPEEDIKEKIFTTITFAPTQMLNVIIKPE